MTQVAESLKAVVCGSNHPSNLSNLLIHIAQLEGLGYEVFPTRKELADDLPSILAKHADGSVPMDEESLKNDGDKMWEYLKKVAESNVLYVANEKNGKEYIGNGTSIVVGFAFAYEKHITFLHVPTDCSVLSALVGYRRL